MGLQHNTTQFRFHIRPWLIHSSQVDIPRIIGWRNKAREIAESKLKEKSRGPKRLSSRPPGAARECACIRLIESESLDPAPQQNNNPVSQTSRLRGAMTDAKQFYNGKKVLVTGAGKGIGRATVRRLCHLGANVVAVSRTQSDLASLTLELGASVSPICVDLLDWKATRESLKEAAKGVNCLVNNAAVAQLEPFMDVSEQHFDQSFGINVKAVMNVSQMVAEDMIKRAEGGSIVNISSQASQRALAEHAVYCSTKGALDMLSKVMALELGKHKIRVNCVNPTVVLTDMGRLGWSDPVKAGPMMSRIPLGRFAEEEDVVEAILFLLSDSAAMVHGCALPVDGGFLVT